MAATADESVPEPGLRVLTKGMGGLRIVYGPASVSIVDREGDLITGPALKSLLPGILLRKRFSLGHIDILPGEILEKFVDPATGAETRTEVRTVTKEDMARFSWLEKNGVQEGDDALFAVGRVYSKELDGIGAGSFCDNVWDQVLKGELNAYSISGKAKSGSRKVLCERGGFACKLVNEISEMEGSAITLCKIGMNQGAGFVVLVKSADKLRLDGFVVKGDDCGCGCGGECGGEPHMDENHLHSDEQELATLEAQLSEVAAHEATEGEASDAAELRELQAAVEALADEDRSELAMMKAQIEALEGKAWTPFTTEAGTLGAQDEHGNKKYGAEAQRLLASPALRGAEAGAQAAAHGQGGDSLGGQRGPYAIAEGRARAQQNQVAQAVDTAPFRRLMHAAQARRDFPRNMGAPVTREDLDEYGAEAPRPSMHLHDTGPSDARNYNSPYRKPIQTQPKPEASISDDVHGPDVLDEAGNIRAQKSADVLALKAEFEAIEKGTLTDIEGAEEVEFPLIYPAHPTHLDVNRAHADSMATKKPTDETLALARSPMGTDRMEDAAVGDTPRGVPPRGLVEEAKLKPVQKALGDGQSNMASNQQAVMGKDVEGAMGGPDTGAGYMAKDPHAEAHEREQAFLAAADPEAQERVALAHQFTPKAKAAAQLALKSAQPRAPRPVSPLEVMPLVRKEAADVQVMPGTVMKPGPGHQHSENFERCLADVRAQTPAGRDPDEYAHRICYSTVGKDAFQKEFVPTCRGCQRVLKALGNQYEAAHYFEVALKAATTGRASYHGLRTQHVALLKADLPALTERLPVLQRQLTKSGPAEVHPKVNP
jgi:hypothetical protein